MKNKLSVIFLIISILQVVFSIFFPVITENKLNPYLIIFISFFLIPIVIIIFSLKVSKKENKILILSAIIIAILPLMFFILSGISKKEIKQQYYLPQPDLSPVKTTKCMDDYLKFKDSGKSLSESFYNLNSNSTGTIEDNVCFYGTTGEPRWELAKIVLDFIDEKNNKKVFAYLDLYSSSNPQIQLFGNKIYYVDKNGNLSALNLLTKQIENINLPGIEKYQEKTINDFFIYNGIVYYLSGKNCNYYMAECDLDLRQYDLNLAENKLLSNHVSYPAVLGHDPLENKLYLKFTFGDAGGSIETIGEYDFENSKISKVVSVGYGYNGPDNLENDAKFKSIEKLLEKQTKRLNGIIIKNGQVGPIQNYFKDVYDNIKYAQ